MAVVSFICQFVSSWSVVVVRFLLWIHLFSSICMLLNFLGWLFLMLMISCIRVVICLMRKSWSLADNASLMGKSKLRSSSMSVCCETGQRWHSAKYRWIHRWHSSHQDHSRWRRWTLDWRGSIRVQVNCRMIELDSPRCQAWQVILCHRIEHQVPETHTSRSQSGCENHEKSERSQICCPFSWAR